MLLNNFTLFIISLLFILGYPRSLHYALPVDVIHQKPGTKTKKIAQSSKLVNKKWKMVYNSARDRQPPNIPDSIMFITEFFQNNKYIQVIHSDTITIGEWHVSPSTSELYVKYRFKKERISSKNFKITELTDSTLILSFNAWFGSAQQRFKALK